VLEQKGTVVFEKMSDFVSQLDWRKSVALKTFLHLLFTEHQTAID
jgi:hypothetical protein